MRLVELFLKETTEEDRAIISLGKAIYDYLQQYADQDLDYEPDDEDAEIVRIGKLGNLFNTPLEGFENINLTIQSDYGLSQVKSNIASEETPIPGANSPGGLWYNYNKTLVFNSDYLSTNDMKSVIVHELRHALDDVKSNYKANQSDRYETPRNKAYRDEKGKPGSNKMSYTAQPAEINARFAEVLNSLTNSLPAVAKFPDSEQTRIRAQRLLMQGLKKHQISDLFPEKEKSRDYKRLVKRGMDFIIKELQHLRSS